MDDPPRGPRILVSDRQRLPVDLEPLLATARDVLRDEGVGDAELSLSFVDEDEMAALHERYLGEPGPTDVLAFPLEEEPSEPARILGDVVICPAVAERAATALPDGLRLLLGHGILHLLGHDHQEPAERDAMWSKQEGYTGMRVQA